jgi:effector-binding domain-containing protein
VTKVFNRRFVGHVVALGMMIAGLGASAPVGAQQPQPGPSATPPAAAAPAPASPTPSAPAVKAAPSTPETSAPPSATPPAPPPAPATAAPTAPAQPAPKTDDKALSNGTAPPDKTEIERNGSPGIPDNATTEEVNVPARTIAMVSGESSYDDAFKSVQSSIATVTAALTKAGLQPSGHPITIFSEPNDKGFKYTVGLPLAAKPEGKDDLGNGVKIGMSPAGKAIKFQHRGAYDDIDSTYDVITAFLDAKGLQVDNPYIEEYLTDLKTADDPNLQVDIYVFKK